MTNVITWNPNWTVSDVKEGIYHNMPDEIYFSIKAVSASFLKEAASKSLRHAWQNSVFNPLREERQETPALAFGKAFHCAVLEATEFLKRFAIEPSKEDYSNNKKELLDTVDDMKAYILKHGIEAKGCKAKADYISAIMQSKAPRPVFWDEVQKNFKGHAEGKSIIKADDMAKIKSMIESLKADKFGSHIFANGKSEVVLVWSDTSTGLLCKAKADFINHTYVADLKTTTDASPDGFAHEIVKYGYYIQAAFYLMGCIELGLKDRNKFAFQAIEKEAPFATATHVLDKEYILLGIHEVRHTMHRLEKYLKDEKVSNVFQLPSYSSHVIKHSAPQWLLNKVSELQDEEDETETKQAVNA